MKAICLPIKAVIERGSLLFNTAQEYVFVFVVSLIVLRTILVLLDQLWEKREMLDLQVES